MASPENDAYDRGRAAGAVDARLEGHDRQLTAISGSLAEMATDLRNLSSGVQSIRDQIAASAVTVIATAKAVHDAEEARVERSQQSWTPVQRFLAVLSAISTVVALLLGLYAYFHH